MGWEQDNLLMEHSKLKCPRVERQYVAYPGFLPSLFQCLDLDFRLVKFSLPAQYTFLTVEGTLNLDKTQEISESSLKELLFDYKGKNEILVYILNNIYFNFVV